MTHPQHPLGGPRAWLNWSIGVAFAVLVFGLQAGYAVTNAAVAGDLGLTIAQVGFVGTIYTWVFAVTQCASGSILDRLGTRWVLPIACLTVSVGAFLFSRATGAGSLLAANALTAVGASFGFIGAGFLGGQWFEPLKYGLMFSLVQFVCSLSAIGMQRALAALIRDTPWSSLIGGLAVIGLGLTLLMLLVLRDHPGARRAPFSGLGSFLRDLAGDLRAVLARRDTWINALVGGATMGTMLGLAVVWGPRLLTAGGMDQAEAFGVNSLAWAGLALGSPLFAWLSERLASRVRALALGCALQLGTLAVILSGSASSPTAASICFFVFGLMAGSSMLPFTVGAELVPPSRIGTSAAVVNATQFIVGGIMMAVPGRVLAGTGLIARLHEFVDQLEAAPTGTLRDHQWALGIMPVALALGLGLCLLLTETYRTPTNEDSDASA